MKLKALKAKTYEEVLSLMGDDAEREFDGSFVLSKTNKGAFVLEHESEPFLGITADNDVIVMQNKNTPAIRHKVNQFLPEGVKLTSKKSVLMLNDSPLQKYNLVRSNGEILMEEE